jgi:hypothetical protein
LQFGKQAVAEPDLMVQSLRRRHPDAVAAQTKPGMRIDAPVGKIRIDRR